MNTAQLKSFEGDWFTTSERLRVAQAWIGYGAMTSDAMQASAESGQDRTTRVNAPVSELITNEGARVLDVLAEIGAQEQHNLARRVAVLASGGDEVNEEMHQNIHC